MSRSNEFQENKFSIGISDVVMAIGLPTLGAATGLFITGGLVNSLEYVTNFSVGSETMKWFAAAGAMAGFGVNTAMALKNDAGTINKVVKTSLSAATFAGLAYASLGTDLFNEKARDEVITVGAPTIEEFIAYYGPKFQDAMQDVIIDVQPQPMEP